MPIHLYTDASFSKETHLGVSGYLLFKTHEDHEAGANTQSITHTETFKESTNIRAEFRGMIQALEKLIELQATETPGETKIYTDCQSITQLLSRRIKLEASGYISGSKQEILPNADLYKKFFTLYDQLNPEIYWVKGHSAHRNNDLIRNNFRYIDKAVRKILREILNRQIRHEP